MSRCEKVKRRKKEVCIGDMNEKISLFVRNIDAPDFEEIDYDEQFQDEKRIWALVETVNGETVFDRTNTEQEVTHRFYIRYIKGITYQNWILFRNDYYDILEVEDLDARRNYLLIKANLRGDKNKPVNLS